MEANQVVEKILADAKAEAEKIIKQAQDAQSAEQAKLDEQLKEYEKQTKTFSQKAAKDTELHLLATARMDIAKDLLAEKRKIIDEVFDKAKEQLKSLPDDDYQKLMTKLMLEAVETGEEEVIIDKQEKRIDQQLIDKVNQQLKVSKNLKLSAEKQDIQAGFILRRGKVNTNVSIDVLTGNARKELEIELAKELFKS